MDGQKARGNVNLKLIADVVMQLRQQIARGVCPRIQHFAARFGRIAHFAARSALSARGSYMCLHAGRNLVTKKDRNGRAFVAQQSVVETFWRELKRKQYGKI